MCLPDCTMYILISIHTCRMETVVSPDQTVQVNPPLDWNGGGEWGSPCVIDNTNEGSIIVSPDLLISPTTIATSTTCSRRYVLSLSLLLYITCITICCVLIRAVLSDLFKGVSGDSIAMTTGSVLHQVFQSVLVTAVGGAVGGVKQITPQVVEAAIRDALSSSSTLNQL